MRKLITLTTLTLLCSTSIAQEPALHYNEASLSYAAYKSGSTTYNGYAADVGAMFTQNIYGLANYQSVDNGHICLVRSLFLLSVAVALCNVIGSLHNF